MNPGHPETYLAFVDPRRAIRWVYAARVGVASAIYVAAVYAWGDADRADTLLASLLITGAIAFTALSATWSERRGRALTTGFLTTQSAFDLLVVTTVVHIMAEGASQFAALYILVIAWASLVLAAPMSLGIATLGCALYSWQTLAVSPGGNMIAVWLQLAIFAAVALPASYIGSRLRDARTRTDALVVQLNKARLQASDILKNIRSGIVTVDRTGTLLYANPAASALLGVDLDAKIGTPILETLEPPAPTLAHALRRATFDRARTTRGEGTIRTATRSFPIGLNTTVTTPDVAHGAAETDGTATVIFQDITDQKKLDTLHLRAERLEAVAELSASLAHEIKNPLAAVRSAVEQLARSPRSNPDEQVLGALIVRESDRLSRLLTEFLDFARVRVTRVEPVDLVTVAREAATLVSSHPDRAPGVEVAANVPADPIVVEGDQDLLYRAVFNLTLNAVQASPPSGRVSVDVAPLTTSDAPAGLSFDRGGVALRVSDQGNGIPEDIRDRLFDPFFTTRPGGSGLGLSVVHRAIEAHKGFVFIDSDPQGTRVTVLLPNYQTETGDAL